jgi:hypothetical protein
MGKQFERPGSTDLAILRVREKDAQAEMEPADADHRGDSTHSCDDKLDQEWSHGKFQSTSIHGQPHDAATCGEFNCPLGFLRKTIDCSMDSDRIRMIATIATCLSLTIVSF